MNQADFSTFVQSFQQVLKTLITENPKLETENRLQGLPREYLVQILASRPLSVFIPEKYGGWGDQPHQCLDLLEKTAYESIAVALMIGINGSLFLEPVAKYGQEEMKQQVFDRFLNQQATGGLMITEPEFGTDALSMQTSALETDKGFTLQGSKHWGGLTGLADYWIITSRKRKADGELARDIDLFVVDATHPDQKIEVTEFYHKLGLFLIPYGLNRIDAVLPHSARLLPKSSGLKLMMDLLHRSRLRLSGIGIGFIKRMLDEAITHCKERVVGGKNLLSYDQVQQRLSQIQAWHTITSGICYYTARVSDVKNDLAGFALQANASKAVLTDMMQDAAQSLLQLTGAKGYRRDHIAGRAIVDSRPFQIFEGSNDVMYSQIGDSIVKEMKKSKTNQIAEFFSQMELTRHSAALYKDLLEIHLPTNLPQRSKVILGKMASRLITTEFILNLSNAGFRQDLVDHAIQVVRTFLAGQLASFQQSTPLTVIEDYQTGADWKRLL